MEGSGTKERVFWETMEGVKLYTREEVEVYLSELEKRRKERKEKEETLFDEMKVGKIVSDVVNNKGEIYYLVE